MSYLNTDEPSAAGKRKYEKPAVKSSVIKETFLACGKCTNGPVEQFLCVIFPEQS